MMNIKIPLNSQFLSDLILQRTGPFLRLGGGNALSNWLSRGDTNSLVNFLKVNNLVSDYLRMVFENYKSEIISLMDKLPRKALKRIVSIGPGNGIFELLLVRENLTTDLCLIDVERTLEHNHGFNLKGSGYANLQTTKTFIESNIKSPLNITLCNPTKEPLPEFEYSLFISILSMGFHYPCDQYTDFIISKSMVNSFVILDKRIDKLDAGFLRILENFSVIHSIKEEKYNRFFLKRN
jgi:hypothetical protein